jgi:hypothetical protein
MEIWGNLPRLEGGISAASRELGIERERPSRWRTKSRLGLPQGTPLGVGRRLRSWRGRTGGELAAKNKQSRYHENDD